MPAASSFPPADRSDLDALRTFRNESGFRNVYRKSKQRDGATRWVAKVKAGGRLRLLRGSASPDPRECARRVVEWYRGLYGDRWRDALLARKRKCWRVWRSRNLGGWCARVWLWGDPCEVPQWRVSRGRVVATDRVAVWLSRAAAEAGLRRYVREYLGLLGLVAVWRVGAADPGATQVPPSRGKLAA